MVVVAFSGFFRLTLAYVSRHQPPKMATKLTKQLYQRFKEKEKKKLFEFVSLFPSFILLARHFALRFACFFCCCCFRCFGVSFANVRECVRVFRMHQCCCYASNVFFYDVAISFFLFRFGFVLRFYFFFLFFTKLQTIFFFICVSFRFIFIHFDITMHSQITFSIF